MKEIKIGDALPNFSLENQNGELVQSQGWIGHPVVVYFYPGDFTPVCTAQACSFRNQFNDFEDYKVKVVGISHDDVASHKKFAEENQLPFDILSDSKNTVRDLFGVSKGVFGLVAGRVTYVFDAKGKLAFQYKADLRAKEHVKKALEAIELFA
jgi:peroxiredoxin Q/BCP